MRGEDSLVKTGLPSPFFWIFRGIMTLQEYFHDVPGHGILATANAQGQINMAMFARPHVMDDGLLAFIMPHRLTHANLQENPNAAYLFWEENAGYRGKRLYLTKVREEQDTDLLKSLRRRVYSPEKEKQTGPKFLVFFRLEKELPLIGTGEPAL